MSRGREIPYANCRVCRNAAAREANKDTATKRAIQLKCVYGLTPEQFDQILTEQSNKCMICYDEFTPDKKPEIDHDHKTGKFRGILCRSCNTLLGKNQENPELLRSKGYDEAAWYLERNEAKNEDTKH